LSFAYNIYGGFAHALEIYSQKTATPPRIDGFAADSVWQEAPAIVTKDKSSGIPINIQSAYNSDSIFFLISFPDTDESRNHKSWNWNPNLNMYTVGKDREDIFVIKWNMEEEEKNLSIYSDDLYKADVWYWKACRTDPVGYADDKYHVLSTTASIEATKLVSSSGNIRYLYRNEDAGQAAYKTILQIEYRGDTLPRYTNQLPTESRANVAAKGYWQDNTWTIEFARPLQTGFQDDVQFDPGNNYQFGVSRYEIAGRPASQDLSQPLYGTGDINESITLRFAK
jgi:hypothetical protein